MQTDRFYLEVAMEEALGAYTNKTYPVGTVIVSPDGNIISRGHNHVYIEGDFTSHAEIDAIRKAGRLLMQRGIFGNCTLYTTMEPCMMCSGAILLAGIKRVIWVMNDDKYGLRDLYDNKHHFNSSYMQKLNDLEISSANEHDDLVECMQTWMEDWNRKKEKVQSHWRQKDSPMQPSLI